MNQLSKWLRSHLSELFVLLVTVPVLMIGASEARAYQTTKNCENCHDGFLTNPYISLSDGANWGDSLHNVHRSDMLNSDCDVCHSPGGRSTVYLDSSSGGDGLSTIGCVGCHGRDEDMGNDSESLGRGAGLRQHHTNAGVSSCSNCHSDASPVNYTPVGEDVLPNYYANPGSNHPLIPDDSCNPNGSEGVFAGTLLGLDNDGNGIYDTADDACSINTPPVADAGGPYSGTVGTPVSFDGSASSDPDGSIASYAWDFGDGNNGTGVSPSHSYASDGTFTVILTVTDNTGGTGSASSSATIAPSDNLPPVADAGGPYSGTVGTPVSFDGSASSDPDGSIASYAWDFGDGNNGTGVSPSHSYASDGTFTVSLTVTDNTGGTGSASSSATIAPSDNLPPVADAGGPYSGTVGTPVSFDGSASSDPDGSIASYAWDFGDGNNGTGVSPSHSYASDGTFTVSLTVTDNTGGTGSASSSATIAPSDNLPPVADAGGPYSGTVGTPVSFDGSASSDPDGSIASYAWDFGDGNNGTGVSPSHSYASDGTFTVSLTVADNTGGTGSASSIATIVTDSLPPDSVMIREAKWEAEDDDSELEVKGIKAPPGELVTITNADTGERIGITRVRNGGEWKFEKELDIAPCRVRATINSQFGEKDVRDAPADCDNGTGQPQSTVMIKEAKWESEDEDSELEVKGIKARHGELVTITNTDTGERIGTTRVREGGEWKFKKELDIAPCRVRATINNQFDEKDVKDAPTNCDNGPDQPPSRVMIKEAKWESEDEGSKLEVKGIKARPGELVTITNTDTGERIGTTRARKRGEWKFKKELDIAPCRVRATINNQFDEKDVKDAPASCGR